MALPIVSLDVVKVEVCIVLVITEFVAIVWKIVLGAFTMKALEEANVPFWKERVLATRLEVASELVRRLPCELSMMAFVKVRVLTAGPHRMFWETSRVLTRIWGVVIAFRAMLPVEIVLTLIVDAISVPVLIKLLADRLWMEF